MKIIFRCTVASFLAILPCAQVTAQTIPSFSRNAKELTFRKPVAIVKKREIIPGVVTFTRQNGCLLKSPMSRNFLEDGTTLETSMRLAISGNNIPKWHSEYKKPWQSKLTDHLAGEYKIMLFQIGRHRPTIVKVEQSDKKLLDAQNVCTIATYRMFKSNLSLLKPISQPRQNVLSLSMERDWERYFDDYRTFQLQGVDKKDK